MIGEIREQETLEALIDKRVDDKRKIIFYGRSVQSVEPARSDIYGEKLVLAAIIVVATLLTGWGSSISAGAADRYYKTLQSRDYPSGDRIIILTIALSSTILTVHLAYIVISMSCKLIKKKPAQISEI